MTLVADVLLGVYIGVLTGAFAAAVVYVLTFAFTYLAEAKLSINYALLIGLGVAGLAGGPRLLLRNPEVLQSTTSLVMLVVVLLLSFGAHGRATELGTAVPSASVALRKLRPRSLSAGVVRQVGRYGQVTIRPTGEVGDLEGYPPVASDVRAAIRTDRWRLAADVPLAELERRLEDRLRADYDLAEADVAIDPDGRASIRVAPTVAGLSRRVEPDTQVLAVETVLPAGLADGDDVVLGLPSGAVGAEVVEVAAEPPVDTTAADPDGDEADRDLPAPPVAGSGGPGRVAVGVQTTDVERVVGRPVEKLYVRSHGQLAVFEFVSRLRRDDLRFLKLTVGPDSPLAGATIAAVPRDDVVVVAVRQAERWRFAPDGSRPLSAGDELYVTGSKAGLDAVGEVLA